MSLKLIGIIVTRIRREIHLDFVGGILVGRYYGTRGMLKYSKLSFDDVNNGQMIVPL